MSLIQPTRTICTRCSRLTLTINQSKSLKFHNYRSFASSSSSRSTNRLNHQNRKWPRLALTILGITIPTTYLFFPNNNSKKSLKPNEYSDQKVTSIKTLSNQHKLITIPIDFKSKEFFENPFKIDGNFSNKENNEIVIQHIMIKSNDLQIERPYTFINDPLNDNEIRMVIKRVQGGEVGRVVHNLKDGDSIGVRGPIPTFSIYPNKYDKIIMISTGTGISPFLQFLSKLSSSSSSSNNKLIKDKNLPKLHLIHLKPLKGKEDWSNSNEDESFLPFLTNKSNLKDKLKITRIELDEFLNKELILNSLKGFKDIEKNQNVLFLICLPPNLMKPLCGNILPNRQGPITGILGEMGLTNEQVWKLD
ncbi:uncharacterized protein I206_104271 [Kwoniella pini CBS 10737]|uniref:FAD-binding FR-type domain-containing protein n=1 Tax=Kwoniella pini CBS 10737 TaxID=1296096 RepID=A0A1B9I2G0_9TREE|nr:uncharacterized protein I206_04153 [Kwoniella pini CBS 10737]OCF49631.1 hypothetical protein I206_04153 [Kwoniella pini CBS 10737]